MSSTGTHMALLNPDNQYIYPSIQECEQQRLELLSNIAQTSTKTFIDKIPFENVSKICDIGCGNGHTTNLLASKAFAYNPCVEVVGIDLSEHTIAKNIKRQNHPNVKFKVGNIMGFSEYKDYWDVIYSRFLIAHLSDPSKAVNRIFQALKPNGFIAIEDIKISAAYSKPDSIPFNRLLEILQKLILKKKANPDIGIQLASLISKAGFSIVNTNNQQPLSSSKELKVFCHLTFKNTADIMVNEALIEKAVLDELLIHFEKFISIDNVSLSFPKIYQVLGKKQ